MASLRLWTLLSPRALHVHEGLCRAALRRLDNTATRYLVKCRKVWLYRPRTYEFSTLWACYRNASCIATSIQPNYCPCQPGYLNILGLYHPAQLLVLFLQLVAYLGHLDDLSTFSFPAAASLLLTVIARGKGCDKFVLN